MHNLLWENLAVDYKLVEYELIFHVQMGVVKVKFLVISLKTAKLNSASEIFNLRYKIDSYRFPLIMP